MKDALCRDIIVVEMLSGLRMYRELPSLTNTRFDPSELRFGGRDDFSRVAVT